MPRVFQKAREPFSSYSHFVGAVLSGLGLLIVLVRLLFGSAVSGSLAAAAVIFCLSLIALYSASSVYHFSEKGEAVVRRLKKLTVKGALKAKEAGIPRFSYAICRRRAAMCSSVRSGWSHWPVSRSSCSGSMRRD